MSLLENVVENSQLKRQLFQKSLHEGPQNSYTCDRVRQW